MARDADEFVANSHEEVRCTVREVVELFRSRIDEAEERTENGTAIFSVDGKDVAGIRITHQKIQLISPNEKVAKDFAKRLGNVQQTEDGLEFEQLADVKRSELKNFIDASSETVSNDAEADNDS